MLTKKYILHNIQMKIKIWMIKLKKQFRIILIRLVHKLMIQESIFLFKRAELLMKEEMKNEEFDKKEFNFYKKMIIFKKNENIKD